MKVSILVPVYGVEKYIRQCTESLFGQTYEDLEYIFVDDCTPDHSIEVLREVLEHYPQRKSQVRIVRQPENRGSGAARALAFELSTGDYLAYVDSDDFVEFDMVERLVRRAEESGADVVDAAYDYYAAGKGGNVFPPSADSNRVYLRRMLLQNTVSHQLWARLIRRQLFVDHELYFEEGINQGEDYSMMPRVLFYATRFTINRLVYHYRVDRVGTFTDHKPLHHVVSYLKANGRVKDYFLENDQEGVYLTALQIGLLKAYYTGVEAGMKMEEIESYCGYTPHGWLFKTCHAWLRRGGSWKVVRAVYLITKRCYNTYLKFSS